MKKLIKFVDEQNGIFATEDKGHLTYYYLTKSNARKFMDYLDVGLFITFSPTLKTKIIDKKKCYRVDIIEQIERKTPRTTKKIYSLDIIRKELYDAIVAHDNYLFVDFEMSMPPYYYKPDFEPEIIQVGYVLTDHNLAKLKSGSYYIKPSKFKEISKRTLKFLKLNHEHFDDAKPYDYFYNDFKTLVKTYKPKMIVWGKNDFLTLRSSYKINNVRPLTTRKNFMNLLQIIKTYYNLYDDIGLANAYKQMVHQDYNQKHDAYHDAYAMMEIFKAFKKQMKKDYKKNI